ncbi:MAG: germination protein YpeB [Clostridia bacterium]|nr:germination protein YpeB [Clostridia bacterium]
MDKNNITSVDYEQEKQDNVLKVNNDIKTKKKSNAQKVLPWLIIAVVSLVIILTCVLIAYYQVYSSSKQNANILEGVYTSSYYSMVDNVNNLAVDISKYSTLSTNKAKTSTIQDMMVDCNYILAGLCILPINEENVISATKFFNQVNGLCEAYLNQLNDGENLSIEQELMFDKIGLVVGKIKANFNEQNYGMYDTGFNFVDASIFDNTGMNELSTGMGDLTESSIEYPAMIFDGPFSTALETSVVKGLPENEVSEKEAYNYLRNTVYKNRDEVKIAFERETNGDIATYDYSVEVEGKDFNAQVSKRGALLITISGYAEGGDAIMGGEQAVELAKTFANNIGFENMESVWLEIHENVAYINLAPVENGVIMYPDLVKVKVDLTAQEIIGFEAVNYALNHVDRSIEFNASASEAENLLGFDYNVLKTSKAVIRLDNGKEISTYEFITERIDGTYFYYIDANNLEIAKTMKLVTIKNIEKLI